MNRPNAGKRSNCPAAGAGLCAWRTAAAALFAAATTWAVGCSSPFVDRTAKTNGQDSKPSGLKALFVPDTTPPPPPTTIKEWMQLKQITPDSH